MRELQLADAASGIADTFEDIQTLAAHCRFGDCQHEKAPGCAVREATGQGRLDAERLPRWCKLLAEDAFNSASLAEPRTKDRAFGKLGGASWKMVTQRLKEMEELGLVKRAVLSTQPVAVAYEITDFGRSSLTVLEQLKDRAETNGL